MIPSYISRFSKSSFPFPRVSDPLISLVNLIENQFHGKKWITWEKFVSDISFSESEKSILKFQWKLNFLKKPAHRRNFFHIFRGYPPIFEGTPEDGFSTLGAGYKKSERPEEFTFTRVFISKLTNWKNDFIHHYPLRPPVESRSPLEWDGL